MTNILMILFVPLCLKGRAVLSHLARFQHDHTTAEGWLSWRFIFFQRRGYNIAYKDGQQGVFKTYFCSLSTSKESVRKQ